MTVQPSTRRVNRGRGHSYLLDGADPAFELPPIFLVQVVAR